MMILGITGCPGSGKSVLAEAVSGRGWMLLDADVIGREVVEGSGEVLGELAGAFGRGILRSDGTLDRRELARRAFSDEAGRRLLNGIVHPRLIGRLKERMDEFGRSGGNVVVDCALIFEWGIEDSFELVVCVAAEESIRKRRLRERDGRSLSEIEGLFAAQLPESEKMRRADIVISNNGSRERLEKFGRMLADVHRYFGKG